jgi:hypothetical protein
VRLPLTQRSLVTVRNPARVQTQNTLQQRPPHGRACSGSLTEQAWPELWNEDRSRLVNPAFRGRRRVGGRGIGYHDQAPGLDRERASRSRGFDACSRSAEPSSACQRVPSPTGRAGVPRRCTSCCPSPVSVVVPAVPARRRSARCHGGRPEPSPVSRTSARKLDNFGGLGAPRPGAVSRAASPDRPRARASPRRANRRSAQRETAGTRRSRGGLVVIGDDDVD